jgi:shikimate dehydrogenase
MLISGAASVAGLIGWPVAHSLSPTLHGHWFERYGIDGTYIPLPVRPEDVELAFKALPRLGFRGWNVTIPHKEAAFRLVDELDPAALRMGAVNTVLVQPDGRLLGRNTDSAGFVAGLRAQAPDWHPGAGPALILGAGGGARAVAAALLDLGVPGLRLTNRTGGKADQLAAFLQGVGAAPVETVPWQQREEALAGVALLVNATSLGMEKGQPLELRLEALPPAAVVADLVYVPLETSLLARARARGHATVDGLGMLLHQAVPGFTHWGGQEPSIDEHTRRLMLNRLAARGR